ncbi:MAG: peptidylprolyl isomerase [Gemmatimonadetes bacterium]|nr:peptidylprolyl isomerase [Gemmatimonadota bacterium]
MKYPLCAGRLAQMSAWAAVSVAAMGASLQAQEGQFREIDRIVAVVGRVPIPMSRIEERVQMLRLANPDLPTDSASMDGIRRTLLDSLIVEEMIVQAAERDTSVFVVEEDVQAQADEQIRSVRESVVSELDFQRAIRESGFATVDEYRLWVARGVRRRMQQQQLFQMMRLKGELYPVPPTEQELREVYEAVLVEQQNNPQRRPPTVTFRQVVVNARADSAALHDARARAESVLVRARAGEDFAALAQEFSDDEASAQRGGDVGWFRRGSGMAKEFERTAFRLRPGQISNVLQTSFGFHVIQVQRTEPAEVQARHILIMPSITERNYAEARSRADTVAMALRNGAALDSILRRYHDAEGNEQTYVEGAVFENLPPEYQASVEGAEAGDIIGPFATPRAGGEKYVVMLFVQRLEAGEYTYEEVRESLRSDIAEQNGVSRFLDYLRSVTYIDIRY